EPRPPAEQPDRGEGLDAVLWVGLPAEAGGLWLDGCGQRRHDVWGAADTFGNPRRPGPAAVLADRRHHTDDEVVRRLVRRPHRDSPFTRTPLIVADIHRIPRMSQVK